MNSTLRLEKPSVAYAEKTAATPTIHVANSNARSSDQNINNTMAHSVAQAQVIVNNSSATSRDGFREQESKDFSKAILQTQQIIGIARGYVTDLVQFNNSR